MKTTSNYFWNNLKTFSSNTAFVDTVIDRSVTYDELESESQALAEKLKLSVKGIHRQSKEMDELRYEKQMDDSSTFINRKKNEKSK